MLNQQKRYTSDSTIVDRLLYIFCSLLLFCAFVFLPKTAHAQPIYNMSNLTVDDCEGILLDSENGDISGTYGHNENYTFSICISGNGNIVMDFISFCTEEDFDFLSIYDGPNTASNQVGEDYHGEVDPPQIVATSGCLTLHFTSDPNVVCTGWEAHWYVEIVDPIPPDILPIPNLPCESDALTIQFNPAIPCDSVYLAAFRLVGPQSPDLIAAQPAPCNGNTTSTVDLTFDSPITASGNYRIIYTTYEINECGALDTIISTEPFAVVDCPLFLNLESDDDVCAGDCIPLQAQVTGGLAGTYTYVWSDDLPNQSIVEVCPLTATTYRLTVSDANGNQIIDSIQIKPLSTPNIVDGDLSICQSADPFTLTATPTDGTWQGGGIINENTPGLYDPSLIESLSDSVIYTAPNGCTDQIEISLLELDQGHDDAACPDSAPFFVSGGFPTGGTWTGDHIDADGLFHPTTIGNFEVTYTHPNGCAGSKWVNVDHITLTNIDSICQSAIAFPISTTPFGGIWSGLGIVDSINGLFDPGVAGAGAVSLTYTVHGCVDSMSIFVKAINAGGALSACPFQAPFILPGNWGPNNGLWSGTGIVDPLNGLYDPSILGDGKNDTLRFMVNGCIDQRVVYIRTTQIGQQDTLRLCSLDDPFELNEAQVGIVPTGGQWTGNGLVNDNGDWFFHPNLAGVGVHQLFYLQNECSDSLWVKVSPTPVVEALSVCVKEVPFVLDEATSIVGNWGGSGIVNTEEGIFDPQVAGVGLHTIYKESKAGCRGEAIIEVYSDEAASIEGLSDFYCYKDSNLVLTFFPSGGILSANEDVINQINPAMLGSGIHQIKYAVGEGLCYSDTTFEIEVGLPLNVTLPFDADSLCFGISTTISALAGGGDSLSGYTYHWDNDLGFGKDQYISPEATTTYTVAVNDGCSETAFASLTTFVHPKIDISYYTGPRVCFDDTTFAVVHASPVAQYQYIWDTEPIQYSDTIYSYPTTHLLRAVNEQNGCDQEKTIELPGFDPIKANFIFSPNQDCISSLDPKIDIIDLSLGAQGGYWDFGDGTPAVPYEFGEPIDYVYADTGTYTIQLHLENEGFCVSEHEVSVCVEAEHRLFAPNAFTPNYDGKNDFFAFNGLDITSIDWQVYNRWGELIFRGNAMEDQWDGSFKGRMVPSGVYTYVARFQTKYGEESSTKGFVTVIR